MATAARPETVAITNLPPGVRCRLRIYAHDPSTNIRHPHHAGIDNDLAVVGATRQTRRITFTNAGNAPGEDQLQMWDNIDVRASGDGNAPSPPLETLRRDHEVEQRHLDRSLREVVRVG